MARVLPPRLCLLEGAEGSQVVTSPRQGVSSLPAVPMPRPLVSSSSLPYLKENSWCESVMGMGGKYRFLSLALLQNTHFDSNTWCKGSGWTCRLL